MNLFVVQGETVVEAAVFVELGAVVGNDHARLATHSDEVSELTSHPLT